MEGITSDLEFVFKKKLKELLNEKKTIKFNEDSLEVFKLEYSRADPNLGNVFYRNLFSGKPVTVPFSGSIKISQKNGEIFRNFEFKDHRVSLHFDNELGEFIINEFGEIVFTNEF